ncbi:MAG: HU family DNA-binding protein [Alistipes sp.]|nr:HU family DNA-binding protein [Alistipes sp.]MBQ3246438.1 HU family DNA-binding protein [Alistipes sp.]
MNKSQLVEAIALETNLSKVDARKSVDAFIDIVIRTLKENDKVMLSGMGVFSVMQRSARVGRNPRTGAQVKIAPKRVIKFRPTIDVE